MKQDMLLVDIFHQGIYFPGEIDLIKSKLFLIEINSFQFFWENSIYDFGEEKKMGCYNHVY